MKAILIILTTSYLSVAFGVCTSDILQIQAVDKSEAVVFFEQGEYYSESEFSREASKNNIKVFEADLCYVEQTFLKACEEKAANSSANGNANGDGNSQGKGKGKGSSAASTSSTNIPTAGLAKNFSCRGKEGVTGGASQVLEESSEIDCSQTANMNSNFCTGGGVPDDKAGEGRRFVEGSGATTAADAVASAQGLLKDGDDSNDTYLSYGDLMYHYQGLKSPKDAVQKQEDSQQEVLLSLAGCDKEDISQCSQSASNGEFVLLEQNPTSALEAIKYMDAQNQAACPSGGIGYTCKKAIVIGLGDLKNYYGIREDGTSLQEEIVSGGGSGGGGYVPHDPAVDELADALEDEATQAADVATEEALAAAAEAERLALEEAQRSEAEALKLAEELAAAEAAQALADAEKAAQEASTSPSGYDYNYGGGYDPYNYFNDPDKKRDEDDDNDD